MNTKFTMDCRLYQLFDSGMIIGEIIPNIIKEVPKFWIEKFERECHISITLYGTTFRSHNFIESHHRYKTSIILNKQEIGELIILDTLKNDKEIQFLTESISLKITSGLKRIKLKSDFEENEAINLALMNHPTRIHLIIDPKTKRVRKINDIGIQILNFNRKLWDDVNGHKFSEPHLYDMITEPGLNTKHRWRKKIKEVANFTAFRSSTLQYTTLGNRWYKANFRPIVVNKHDPEKMRKWVGIEMDDVTEEIEAKRKKEVAEARYNALYTNTLAMIHSIDEDQRITNVSDYWLEALGYEGDRK